MKLKRADDGIPSSAFFVWGTELFAPILSLTSPITTSNKQEETNMEHYLEEQLAERLWDDALIELLDEEDIDDGMEL